jgi:hypothetical protein
MGSMKLNDALQMLLCPKTMVLGHPLLLVWASNIVFPLETNFEARGKISRLLEKSFHMTTLFDVSL